MLRFSDGTNVDTRGPLRPLHLRDGWYVAGEGMLLPVESEQDARDEIAALKAKDKGAQPDLRKASNCEGEFLDTPKDMTGGSHG